MLDTRYTGVTKVELGFNMITKTVTLTRSVVMTNNWKLK